MSVAKVPVIDVVCWDWNGTLLDDAEIARAVMNQVLQERHLPLLPDQTAYRRAFGFPIRSFYARLGVTDGAFIAAADQYLTSFAGAVAQAPLQLDAKSTLGTIGTLGIKQVLISATLERILEQQMAPHALDGFFAQILGITDAYAASKADVVESWLRTSGHDPHRVLMVGDTNHDEEIADALGVNFLRFDNGHQLPPEHQKYPVVHRLRDVIGHVHGTPSRVHPKGMR